MSTPPGKARPTTVYIDGFNLYYRAVRGTPHKWLDLVRLAERVLGPKHQVVRVRYFTARITATPHDPNGPQRQQVYLEALDAHPRVTIHEGQFRRRNKKGAAIAPRHLAGQRIEISTFEEKGSDVNLATWALADAYENRTEVVVLLTNDSDLAEPARVLQQRGTTVGVIVPAPGLRSNTVPADFLKTLRPTDLAASQLPNPLRLPTGQVLHKPASW